MPDAEDPWAPFVRLREALQEAVGPLGINVREWIVFPDAHSGTVLFIVDPEAFLTNEERETKAQFEEMMSEQARHELAERSKENVKNLLKNFGVTPSD